MMNMDEAVGAGSGEVGAVDGDAVSALMQTMARLETQQATNHSLAASEFARLETQQVRLAIPLRRHHGDPSYFPPTAFPSPQERLAKQVADQFASLNSSLEVLLRCALRWKRGTIACWFSARGRMI